jgi:para-nitrobenzyl esterase
MRRRVTPDLTCAGALLIAALVGACGPGEPLERAGAASSADAAGAEARDAAAPAPGATQDDETPDASAPAAPTPDATSADAGAWRDEPSGGGGPEASGAPGGCAPVGGMLAGDPLVIPTGEGPVVGLLRDGTRSWRGIPYAAAPIGDLRFRPPASAACRAAPLVASDFGDVCPQPISYGEDLAPDAIVIQGTEDCLTLNIWAPMAEACEPSGCPVLVWLHGGGHVGGGATMTLPGGGLAQDGATLAADHGVIVVTVQSRLGALGWLAHPALAAEQSASPLGNYGLLDQQQALRWVQGNIRAFGGDTGRVTLAGTSAGAVQTALHVAAPSSNGLFARAAVMSGAATARSLEAAFVEGERSVARTACHLERGEALLACLRALPVDALVAATHSPPSLASTAPVAGARLGPTIDGRLIPASPLGLIANRYASKNAAPPPLLVGSNAEELVGLLPVSGLPPERWPETVRALVAAPLAEAIGVEVQRVLAELLAAYPLTRYASADEAIADLFTDLRFTCPARRLLDAASGYEAQTWRYLFARRAATAAGPAPASHGREIAYFLGSWRNLAAGGQPDEVDQALSDAMTQALAGFVRDGHPDHASPRWTPWGEGGATLVLDARSALEPDPRGARCDVWDRLVRAH